MIKGIITNKPRKWIYNYGLANFLNCYKQAASKIKNSRQIHFAKISKQFIFAEEEVVSVLSFNEKGANNG